MHRLTKEELKAVKETMAGLADSSLLEALETLRVKIAAHVENLQTAKNREETAYEELEEEVGDGDESEKMDEQGAFCDSLRDIFDGVEEIHSRIEEALAALRDNPEAVLNDIDNILED